MFEILNSLKNFILFICSISFPLLVFEIFISIKELDKFSTREQKISYQKNLIKDKRLAKLAKSEGFEPYYFPEEVAEYGNKYNIYPIGSLPHKNAFSCNEGYGLIKYKTDRFGLRNNDKKWEPEKLKALNIFIGDSFVASECVEDEKTLTDYYQSLSGINTINLSSGSNSSYTYMALIKHIIKPLNNINKSRMNVVVVYYDNDNIHEKRTLNNQLIKSTSPINFSRNLKLKINQSYLKGLKNAIKDLDNDVGLNRYKEKNLSKKRIKKFVIKTLKLKATRTYINIPIKSSFQYIASKLSIDYFKDTVTARSIKKLSLYCNNQCKPYIAYIPKRSNTTLTRNYGNNIEKVSKKYGIKFINLSKEIDLTNLDYYSPRKQHFSPLGNEKVAKVIFNAIQKNLLKDE